MSTTDNKKLIDPYETSVWIERGRVEYIAHRIKCLLEDASLTNISSVSMHDSHGVYASFSINLPEDDVEVTVSLKKR